MKRDFEKSRELLAGLIDEPSLSEAQHVEVLQLLSASDFETGHLPTARNLLGVLFQKHPDARFSPESFSQEFLALVHDVRLELRKPDLAAAGVEARPSDPWPRRCGVAAGVGTGIALLGVGMLVFADIRRPLLFRGTVSAPAALAAANELSNEQTAGNVMIVGGAVSVGSALATYLLTRRDEGRPVVSLGVQPGEVAATVSGRF